MIHTMLKYYMRYESGESMESWAERVRKYEFGFALQQIAKGENAEIVMEAMSARIVQKLLHPLVSEISKSSRYDSNYDPEESKRQYFEKMQFRKPAPDHVDEND